MNALPWKRRLLRGSLVLLITATIALIVGWLSVQHIPAWYTPPTITPESLPRIRASLPNTYQAFTDLLAGGGTFEFQLSARTINEWIAARTELWPDSADNLPDWVRDPVVGFVDDRIILATRLERGNWRTILSGELQVTAEGDELLLRLVRIAAGSFPIPLASAVDAMDQQLTDLLKENGSLHDAVSSFADKVGPIDSLRRLRDGLRFGNRLYWSNGERHFRITRIRANEGLLTLHVESL